MADVPFTIAVIGIVSPVVAGAIPVIIGWIRDSGRDKRDRAERVTAEQVRLEQERRTECVRLLRLARDFRVLVENACDSTGPDLAPYAQRIRQAAADITGQADEVGFIVFQTEAAASSLATEARLLADTIVDGKNRALGASLLSPDFTVFDRCLAEFKTQAQAAFGYLAAFTSESAANGGRPAVTSGSGGRESAALGLGQSPSAPGQLRG